MHKTDRKSTRLNSSHLVISYAVFCLKKKEENNQIARVNPLCARRHHTPHHGRASADGEDAGQCSRPAPTAHPVLCLDFIFFLKDRPPPGFPPFPPPPPFPL